MRVQSTDAYRFTHFLAKISKIGGDNTWPPKVEKEPDEYWDDLYGFMQLSVMPGSLDQILQDMRRLGANAEVDAFKIRGVLEDEDGVNTCAVLFRDTSVAVGMYLGQGEIAWRPFEKREEASAFLVEHGQEWDS